jgi:hypothetical protein
VAAAFRAFTLFAAIVALGGLSILVGWALDRKLLEHLSPGGHAPAGDGYGGSSRPCPLMTRNGEVLGAA